MTAAWHVHRASVARAGGWRVDVGVLAGDHFNLSSVVDRPTQSIVVQKHLRRIRNRAPLLICSGNHDLHRRADNGDLRAYWVSLAGVEVARLDQAPARPFAPPGWLLAMARLAADPLDSAARGASCQPHERKPSGQRLGQPSYSALDARPAHPQIPVAAGLR